ncbi:MAG: UDP-N-acetylmuramoyl-L-alanine--D-glutamate ligase, partial [Nitrospirae bacterium]
MYDASLLENPAEALPDAAVTVVGMGRSGMAAARLLQTLGARVTLVDQRTEAAIQAQEVLNLGRHVHVLTGARWFEGLLYSQLVIISPGVPSQLEPIARVRARGVPVVSEIELASWFLTVPLIAVTGTNGKSTVASLIGAILEHSGVQPFVGGNLGTPLSEAVLMERQRPTGPRFDCVVAEVSSFQLENVYRFHPHIAVMLNLTPDHLDRYASFAEYQAAKERIFSHQGPYDLAVLNADDPLVAAMSRLCRGTILTVSLAQQVPWGVSVSKGMVTARFGGQPFALFPAEDVPLLGQHNLANVLAATAVGLACGVPGDRVGQAIRSFRGLDHALEHVRERGGVMFVNDSKGTNIDATLRALESFRQPIVLILGGK